MKRLSSLSAGVLAGLLALPLVFSSCVFAATLTFTAELNGSSIFPPVATFATGQADFTYDTELEKLSWSITYRDLSGPPLQAGFYRRDDFGRPSVLVHALDGSLASRIKGATDLPLAEARELFIGEWFFVMHSVIFPDGEIGGAIEVTRSR